MWLRSYGCTETGLSVHLAQLISQLRGVGYSEKIKLNTRANMLTTFLCSSLNSKIAPMGHAGKYSEEKKVETVLGPAREGRQQRGFGMSKSLVFLLRKSLPVHQDTAVTEGGWVGTPISLKCPLIFPHQS